MSRTTPVPVVKISHTSYSEDTGGRNIVNILIDVESGSASSGFIVLDEPDDLFILRDAIDKFITDNSIKKNPHQ